MNLIKNTLTLSLILYGSLSYAISDIDFKTKETAKIFCPISSTMRLSSTTSIQGYDANGRVFRNSSSFSSPPKVNSEGKIKDLDFTKIDNNYGSYHCSYGYCTIHCNYLYLDINNNYNALQMYTMYEV